MGGLMTQHAIYHLKSYWTDKPNDNIESSIWGFSCHEMFIKKNVNNLLWDVGGHLPTLPAPILES